LPMASGSSTCICCSRFSPATAPSSANTPAPPCCGATCALPSLPALLTLVGLLLAPAAASGPTSAATLSKPVRCSC
jgi:hypothetical protein